MGAIITAVQSIIVVAEIGEIIAAAQSVIKGLLSAVGAVFALWGGIDVGTGFSQHNAAKQEAGIPKIVGGVAVIAMVELLVPKIFEFLKF